MVDLSSVVLSTLELHVRNFSITIQYVMDVTTPFHQSLTVAETMIFRILASFFGR